MIIPFPPFEPDKAPYNRNATATAVNVLPTADGWGPMASLSAFADALPSEPRGIFTGLTASGTQVTIVGTATALYRIGNDGSLTDVSGASAPYSVPVNQQWSFDVFGDRIIATNGEDDVQYYDIGSSTDFADLPGSPPKARYVKTLNEFVVLYNLTSDPSALHWSGINNSEQWTRGEELSDMQPFPDGGPLQAMAINGTGAILAFREGFRVMTFAPGSGFVFTFSPLVKGKGCAAPLSLVDIGRGDFVYFSNTGFYRGTSGTPIGAQRVDKWFTSVCSQPSRDRIVGVADPFQKIVLWRYQDVDANGRVLGYAWELDRWFWSDTSITGIGAYSTSAYSLEDLDALYPSIEDVPVSLDSDAFAGSLPVFAGFDASYRLGFFSGPPQMAMIGTNSIEMSSGSRTFVDAVRVITDATSPSLSVGKANTHADEPTYSAYMSPSSRSGLHHVRSDARLHSFRTVIPSGAVWTTISGIDVIDPMRSGRL